MRRYWTKLRERLLFKHESQQCIICSGSGTIPFVNEQFGTLYNDCRECSGSGQVKVRLRRFSRGTGKAPVE